MRLIDSKIINPFTLEFRDKQKEADYRESFYLDYIRNSRLVVFVVALLDFLSNFARFTDFNYEFFDESNVLLKNLIYRPVNNYSNFIYFFKFFYINNLKKVSRGANKNLHSNIFDLNSIPN